MITQEQIINYNCRHKEVLDRIGVEFGQYVPGTVDRWATLSGMGFKAVCVVRYHEKWYPCSVHEEDSGENWLILFWYAPIKMENEKVPILAVTAAQLYAEYNCRHDIASMQRLIKNFPGHEGERYVRMLSEFQDFSRDLERLRLLWN